MTYLGTSKCPGELHIKSRAPNATTPTPATKRHYQTIPTPKTKVAAMQRAMFLRSLRLAIPRATPTRSLSTITRSRPTTHPQYTRSASHASPNYVRWLSSKSVADEKIEEITELYATAQDEFEIAMEETEKQTVYAEEDRTAAREELTKVQEAYKAVVEGPDSELASEVKRRIGQRIRELEQGVAAMEEVAQNQD
ncbi:hypothetical protein KC331_g15330 [Hortaea werneckii]|nr:hypothetical protein KC331_g15330 [Hortaea werneckii]KAI7709229.1 hypothetical protein KC353_g10509 [Hortaea werneckii]